MSTSPITPEPLRVVVVGGGVAAVEAVLALHALAGARVAVTLIAPEPAFSLRPLLVAGPFGGGPVGEVPLADLMAEHGGVFRQDVAESIDPTRRVVRCGSGDEIPYDDLLLAPGARAVPALRSGITFDARSAGSVGAVARAVELGWARTVAFVVPDGCTWPFTLYELALQTADQVQDRYGVSLQLITLEPTPLAVFGPEASEQVAKRLRESGIAFRGGVQARLCGTHELEIGTSMPLRVDRLVTLPTLHGPALNGVPADPNGFIPVDRYSRVAGLQNVWAAGDGTDQPIKQGGIACQQADSIATQIAAAAGIDLAVEPPPLVLRGRLFAGPHDEYLQRTVGQEHSETPDHDLWSPAAKIASRYLTPYLQSKHIGVVRRHTAA